MMLAVALALVAAPTASKSGWYSPVPTNAPAQYIPYFDDPPMIACVSRLSRRWALASQRSPFLRSIEAENMTVTKGDWLAGDWGHAPTRYAATVANTFMSRRSCLHAPSTVGSESAATATFKVAAAASYNVLLRYVNYTS